ncbi:response regulator [Oligoflexia bacterium]|nr:response regulator [Oligoflexia bacterium]
MESVLVIDDCEDFREVVSDLLEDAGYNVCVASGPDEAREFIKDNKFDLIICDLVMPVDPDEGFEDEEDGSAMVGVHAISEFSKSHPEIPIVAVSGQMESSSLQAMQAFGAFDTLAKPFGREELLKAVEGALKRPGAAS